VGCVNSICPQWAIPLTHPRGDECRSSRSIGLRFHRLLTSTLQTLPARTRPSSPRRPRDPTPSIQVRQGDSPLQGNHAAGAADQARSGRHWCYVTTRPRPGDDPQQARNSAEQRGSATPCAGRSYTTANAGTRRTKALAEAEAALSDALGSRPESAGSSPSALRWPAPASAATDGCTGALETTSGCSNHGR
jgi:hypothetical protein